MFGYSCRNILGWNTEPVNVFLVCPAAMYVGSDKRFSIHLRFEYGCVGSKIIGMERFEVECGSVWPGMKGLYRAVLTF